MITHIVMWKLADQAEGNDKATNATLVKDKLEALTGEIFKIDSLQVGLNINDADTAWDVVLNSDFSDPGALQAYQVHPSHQKVAEFIRAVTVERAVVDYEY